MVSNVDRIEAELALMQGPPPGLSQMALTLAAGLDDTSPSLAMKAMAARELLVTMDRIRELAPPATKGDFVDALRDELAEHRSTKAKARESA